MTPLLTSLLLNLKYQIIEHVGGIELSVS